MKDILNYLNEINLGELDYKYQDESNTIILFYLLKSNLKRQRKLKVVTIEEKNEMYILNSIISFSDNRYIKSLEIAKNDSNELFKNISCIIELFNEIKQWILAISEFHIEKFPTKVRVINDLDFMYSNDEISYRFSVNPGGLIVRANLNGYSRDSFEILKNIAGKCTSLRGTCILEG